jgi:hypothetical protein
MGRYGCAHNTEKTFPFRIKDPGSGALEGDTSYRNRKSPETARTKAGNIIALGVLSHLVRECNAETVAVALVNSTMVRRLRTNP